MTILERRALLGDHLAQKECTRKGIILPCPCCGNKANRYENSYLHYAMIVCTKCECKTESDSIVNALENWNMRPAPPIGKCKYCENKKRAIVNEKGFLICPASGMEITDADFCSYFDQSEDEELSDSELAEDTNYKCLICINHKLCMTPGLKPLCEETYDHFERGYSTK